MTKRTVIEKFDAEGNLIERQTITEGGSSRGGIVTLPETWVPYNPYGVNHPFYCASYNW